MTPAEQSRAAASSDLPSDRIQPVVSGGGGVVGTQAAHQPVERFAGRFGQVGAGRGDGGP
jgi:hypothetical protein